MIENQQVQEGRLSTMFLLEMEAELHQLKGVIAVMRVLSEATDSIEPIAIAFLSRAAGNSVDEIVRCWRAALTGVHV